MGKLQTCYLSSVCFPWIPRFYFLELKNWNENNDVTQAAVKCNSFDEESIKIKIFLQKCFQKSRKNFLFLIFFVCIMYRNPFHLTIFIFSLFKTVKKFSPLTPPTSLSLSLFLSLSLARFPFNHSTFLLSSEWDSYIYFENFF